MDLHHIGIVSKKNEVDKFFFNKNFEYKIVDKKQNNILYFFLIVIRKFGLSIYAQQIVHLQFQIF